jgi:hypothetical protein
LLTGSDFRDWRLPRRTIQHPFARSLLCEHRFNGASHLGIGFRQQRVTPFAGFFQRGVIQCLDFLPIFAVRLETLEVRVNVIAGSKPAQRKV